MSQNVPEIVAKWGLILTDFSNVKGQNESPNITANKLFGQGILLQDNRLLSYLKHVESTGKIHSVDYHFASFIYRELKMKLDVPDGVNLNFITLLAAYASNQVLNQHTCIELTSFNPVRAFGMALPEDVILPEQSLWLEVLADSGICDMYRGEEVEKEKPFVLYDNLFYLNRYFQYEWFIAQFIAKPSNIEAWYKSLNEQDVTEVCSAYFINSNNSEVDWQQQAVLNAIKRRFAVITGGPGTGKTTTVVKLLACLQELKVSLSSTPLNIQLVAPTGKAAQRLSESIAASLNKLSLSQELQMSIPTQASTIHRLLKPRGLTGFAYHQDNKLSLDVLILDEASMVDISLMYKLFAALPEHAQVILLGDKQQLASVEAGNVLAELAQAENHDFMVELKKSYRFDDASAIGQLAQAIKSGNSNSAIDKLQQGQGEIYWYRAENKQLPVLIEHVVEHYIQLQMLVAQADLADGNQVQQIFHLLSQFQLLACVRQGEFGVDGLNSQIQSRIARRTHKLITATHYECRPIMISENAYHLDLYNGDIGIELINPDNNQLMAYFIQGDGAIKQIHCQRLPSHETVYAMTVHKSQGSEFTHAALILPDHVSSLVSREIIYTGLTRAKNSFSLYAGEYNLRQGLQSNSERYSGLAKMLQV